MKTLAEAQWARTRTASGEAAMAVESCDQIGWKRSEVAPDRAACDNECAAPVRRMRTLMAGITFAKFLAESTCSPFTLSEPPALPNYISALPSIRARKCAPLASLTAAEGPKRACTARRSVRDSGVRDVQSASSDALNNGEIF